MKKIFLLLSCLAGFCAAAGSSEHPVKVVLQPFREAEIVARIDGMVEAHKFRMGEHFKTGDLLLKIDDTRFKIDLARAVARANEAKVQADFAQQTYEAQKELFEQNFQSKLELQRRAAEAETAQARKLIGEADVAEAKMFLSFCSVLAPFPGKIERIHCREFENVRIGQVLIKIIDDEYLLAVMNMPLTELQPVGTELFMQFQNGKIEVSGKIQEISPQADHRSGTIEVKVLVANTKGILIPGMTGTWQARRHAEERK